MTTNFEPHKYVIVAQTSKIGTRENKAILAFLMSQDLRFYIR